MKNREERALKYIGELIQGSLFEGRVFLAGGAVRDEMLGLDVKDIDLVVNLPDGGIAFAEWVTQKTGSYKEGVNPLVFANFGTAKFNLRGVIFNGEDLSDIDIEAVMPRTEVYHEHSRKPEVDFGNLKKDAERRDFTVNSLMKNLSNGEILDLTGMGVSDIKNGIVRTVLEPDRIFSDDPLRMLRGIRFAVKYNWKLPLYMIKAIRKNATTIQKISMERVRDEVSKMLVLKKPDVAIRLLQITNLADYFAPELQKIVGLQQNEYHKWDVNRHSLEVLKLVKPELVTRLAALFHDIGKYATFSKIDGRIHFYNHEHVGAEITKEILRRLKYPNDTIDAVCLIIQNHMRLKQAGDNGKKIADKSLRKLKHQLGEYLDATLDVIHADNRCHADGYCMPEQVPEIRKRLETLDPPNQKISLPVNGFDLMERYGLKPGREIGVLLNAVQEACFENPALSRQQAFDLLDEKADDIEP